MRSIQTRFDDMVSAHRGDAYDAIDELHDALEAADCKFGETIVPTFLKPVFISYPHEAELGLLVTRMVKILEKAIAAYFDYPELRPLFGVSKKLHPFLEMDPGYKRNIVISRPDALVDRSVYRFIEFNCDSPAGPGYADVQEAILHKTWPMQHLSKYYAWKRFRRMECLLNSIVECYREYGGKHRHPQIAIIDWRTVRTQGEFSITKRFFEKRGYPTVIADPRELKLRQGKLWANGFRVDLIYRRVIVKELLHNKRYVRDLLKAYAHGNVCVVNPLRSRLAANKSILSIITNPAYNYLFSAKEIEVREKHIPWTRLVVDAKKFYGGKSVYLTQMIDEHRMDLVLKPVDGYGGRDVKIGCETSRAEWRRTIKRALRGSERWVVQEYVNIPDMLVPVQSGKHVVSQRKKINMNPYVFGGKYAGCLARLSDEMVINVSRGGGLIPCIAYKRK